MCLYNIFIFPFSNPSFLLHTVLLLFNHPRFFFYFPVAGPVLPSPGEDRFIARSAFTTAHPPLLTLLLSSLCKQNQCYQLLDFSPSYSTSPFLQFYFLIQGIEHLFTKTYYSEKHYSSLEKKDQCCTFFFFVSRFSQEQNVNKILI